METRNWNATSGKSYTIYFLSKNSRDLFRLNVYRPRVWECQGHIVDLVEFKNDHVRCISYLNVQSIVTILTETIDWSSIYILYAGRDISQSVLNLALYAQALNFMVNQLIIAGKLPPYDFGMLPRILVALPRWMANKNLYLRKLLQRGSPVLNDCFDSCDWCTCLRLVQPALYSSKQ